MHSMMRTVNWQSRYPDIHFFLSFFPFEQRELSQDPEPLLQWIKTQKLDEIEVIYIAGLIGFPLPDPLQDWLAQKKERALVFIEEDLGAFAAFEEENLLDNPQVHFHYQNEPSIRSLAEIFPTDRLAIFEGKSFDSDALIQASACLSALYSDVLYSHKIVDNVCTNFRRLKGCFDARGRFEKIPALICGAGPSLQKAIPILKNCEEKALIFAGGSAITALTLQGVQPHFAMALDPNDEEYDRLKQAHFFEGPFLFAPRLHKDVFLTCNGPFGYLKSDTGGLIENILEETVGITGEAIGPDLGEQAFSVTTLATSYAFALGCDPIIFAGVDLAYTGGSRYMEGFTSEQQEEEDPRALEKRKMRKDIFGSSVETLLKWEMESACISAFAKSHPEVTFINASEGGIGFDGIPNISLTKILSDFPQHDLHSKVHEWIQASQLHCCLEKVYPFLIELTSSLEKCEKLCIEIILILEKQKGEGILALHQSDLAEEMAYKALLEGIDAALSRILFRYYPHLDPEQGKRQCELAKYQELKRQIHKFKEILHKVLNKVPA